MFRVVGVVNAMGVLRTISMAKTFLTTNHGREGITTGSLNPNSAQEHIASDPGYRLDLVQSYDTTNICLANW